MFCFEGDWERDLRRSTPSVRSLIELLTPLGIVQAVYRDVGTVEELTYYLNIWLGQERYEDYRLGWFEFHGSSGEIEIGGCALTFGELADLIARRGAGRLLHLGSCSTCDVDESELESFRRLTKLRLVTGFDNEVEWVESAAFAMLYFQMLQVYARPADAVKAALTNYSQLTSKLGFRSTPVYLPW